MNEDLDVLIRQLSLKQKAALVCGGGSFESAHIEPFEIPALIFSDGSQGIRRQAHAKDHLGILPSIPSTCFPAASSLSCSWDKKLMERIGEAVGKEARKLNVDILLAPAINMIRHPAGGRNFEYFSEDPVLTGILASALIEGIQKYVSACPKHFLLNSQETNRMALDERASETAIMEFYYPAFERVIRKAQPDWIMSSYNKVNGVYASENEILLKGLLRQNAGFEGAVVTDWGGGNDIVKAIQAGSTLEMPSTRGQSEKAVIQAIEQGRLSEADLDERVREMLEAVLKAEKRRKLAPADFSVSLHHDLSVAAARKSAVLLKNRDHLLPLSSETSVCFVGDFEGGFPIQGSGSASVNPSVHENFKELLRKYSEAKNHFASGYRIRQNKADIRLENQALKAAEKADVIVILAAYPVSQNTEGLDRTLKDLPENQKSLIRRLRTLRKPMILIDAIAGAIELSSDDAFDSILYMGLAGQGARSALLSLIYGEVSPSGRLAFTMAYHQDDHPVEGHFPQMGPRSDHTEENKVGYRYFHHQHVPVRYPFGYGLSYTEFRLRKAKAEKDGIRFWVENTGSKSADAILQLYRKFRSDDHDDSLEELCGFCRMKIAAGEIREGFIEFDEYTFRQYLPQQHRYTILKGEAELNLAWNIEESAWKKTVYLSDGEYAEKELPAILPVYFQSEDWPLSLESPLSEFVHAPNKQGAALIKKLMEIRKKADERNRPNLMLCALLDMPLKSLCKLYPNLMNLQKAERILAFMQKPDQKNAAELFELASILLSRNGKTLITGQETQKSQKKDQSADQEEQNEAESFIPIEKIDLSDQKRKLR